MSMPTEKKEAKRPYLTEMIHFYFAPELRSAFTIFYLIVFGFFAFYYVDNLFLAMRFLWHVTSGTTALYGTSYLFTGMAFVVALIIPFSMSLYSLFVLFEIWRKRIWSNYLKWVVTFILMIGTILAVMMADETARLAARADTMRSFIEDMNLTGRI